MFAFSIFKWKWKHLKIDYKETCQEPEEFKYIIIEQKKNCFNTIVLSYFLHYMLNCNIKELGWYLISYKIFDGWYVLRVSYKALFLNPLP